MLSKDERKFVVRCMREYPVGIDSGMWGSSEHFRNSDGSLLDPSVIDPEIIEKYG